MNVNKYHKWYDQLIDRAHARTLTGYTEKHHIVPRSLGGTDEASNLVRLTAREHLIAHMLLPRFVDEPRKMWYALWCMTIRGKEKLTGRLYEQVRKRWSVLQKEKTMSEEAKRKISAYKKGRPMSEESKKKLSATRKERGLGLGLGFKGLKHSEETKRKMSATRKGRIAWSKGKKMTEEWKERRYATIKSRQALSPYCTLQSTLG